MELRPYELSDWTAVCEIYDRAKPDELRGVVDPSSLLPLASDSRMTALFRESQIVVALDADRVVAFGGNRESFVTWLFVHPDFRRRGIGIALVRNLIARLKPPVTLNVASSNAAARALYERLGFITEREYLGNFQGQPCPVCKLRYGTV